MYGVCCAEGQNRQFYNAQQIKFNRIGADRIGFAFKLILRNEEWVPQKKSGQIFSGSRLEQNAWNDFLD